MSRVLYNYPNYVTNPYKEGSHNGIDIVGKTSKGGATTDYIMAHSSGVVVTAFNGQPKNNKSNKKDYGNYVEIKHDNGMYTLYAHLKHNTISVNVGDKVTQGQTIGYMGNTGYSFGAHLHFEVFDKNRNKIDPTPYIDADLPKANNQADTDTNTDNAEYVEYVVQKGDTLSKIAKEYNTTVAILVELNNISNPNVIRIGQVIKVPVEKKQKDIEKLPIIPTEEPTEYTVQDGDTLESIANAHGITIEKLISLNVKLIKGDVLKVK